MAVEQLEDRVAALEEEVARLKNSVGSSTIISGWEKIVGTFADDPMYEEAMRLGREYRQSQPTAFELGAEADDPS